ncbi:MAG: hypothetical protein JW958_07270 [Candidatus Eisenbacteria bacterium]|nr:hypothetical protein [Candidatus Eisenbacteria bacterium]
MKLHVSMALLLLVALLLPAAAVGERLEDALLGVAQHYDPVPWAGNRTASAILTSPADLAVFDHPELSYGRTAREGGEDEEGVFCVRSKWVGFAVETLEPFEGEGYRRYTFAFARPLSRKLAAGVAYTRIGSAEGDLDGYGHWDAGAAWRPVGSLEIAANGRGLTREELGTRKPGRIWEGAVRLDLSKERLALYTQARHFAGDDFMEETRPLFGAEYRPWSSLILRGWSDTDRNRGLGLEFNFGTSSIGFHYRFTGGDEDISYSYFKLHGQG